MSTPEQTVSVRYMVDDVQAAIDFYTGPGGKQILIEDPAGNVVELFEPASGSPVRR